jgi:hypothetical protein
MEKDKTTNNNFQTLELCWLMVLNENRPARVLRKFSSEAQQIVKKIDGKFVFWVSLKNRGKEGLPLGHGGTHILKI